MSMTPHARLSERQARRAAEYAAKYPALARRRIVAPTAVSVQPNFSVAFFGHDEDGRPVFLDDETRLRHAHFVGATGSGKTTALKNMALQDIRRGRGTAIFDPHGSHPGSLLQELQEELEADGFFETGRIHLIEPNITTHVTPFNFLGLENTDASVIADAFLEAVSVAFKGEDLYSKPTTRKILRAMIMVLADLRLPVSDALLFLDPYDRDGVRAHAIERVTNPYAREELRQLHFIGEERSQAR
jgi:type IV secretory pathway VirB4 component